MSRPRTPSRRSRPPTRIAIVAATPANLKALAAHMEQVERFTKSGGWLVLNGLTPEGWRITTGSSASTT